MEELANCLSKYGVMCYDNNRGRSKEDINNDINKIWNKLVQGMKDEIIYYWHKQNFYGWE